MKKLTALADFQYYKVNQIDSIFGGRSAFETHKWTHCGTEGEDYEVDEDQDPSLDSSAH